MAAREGEQLVDGTISIEPVAPTISERTHWLCPLDGFSNVAIGPAETSFHLVAAPPEQEPTDSFERAVVP